MSGGDARGRVGLSHRLGHVDYGQHESVEVGGDHVRAHLARGLRLGEELA